MEKDIKIDAKIGDSIIRFENMNDYQLKRLAEIHINSGLIDPISEENESIMWESIFDDLSVLPKGYYLDIINKLKENYHPPMKKKP